VRHVTDDAVTALLMAARDGDEAAFQSLFDRLYAELRRLAHVVRAGHEPATLDTTELVHEAYLKLVPGRGFTARDRLHFFRIAARAMRQVLVDAARRRSTRAERQVRLKLEPITAVDALSTDILALDAVLTALEAVRPRQASVVECRFFAGLSVEDTAAALDISAPTVKRDWRTARAWLADALEGGSTAQPLPLPE
jgi:RNA polymerase sigma factor (TIGR02999 family)